MRSVSKLLLVLGSVYALLLILSSMIIVPHYLTGGITGIFRLLFTESEPEVDLVISFVLPLLWVAIPLSSLILCWLAWVVFTLPSPSRTTDRLVHAGGGVLFMLSIIPAILVIRELLVYEQVHVVGGLSSVFAMLNAVTSSIRVLLTPSLMSRWGSLAVPVVIFVETGLFFGFFLPGDSLLFTVGVLASLGQIDLVTLIPLTILAAIAGDQVSYMIGYRSGEALAERFPFVRNNLGRARLFYERHGGKAIVIARFVPVVRTFAPAVAGAAGMRYATFVAYNIVGGVFWVLSAILVGYLLGRVMPGIVSQLYVMIIIIIAISVLPAIFTWIRKKMRHAKPD